MENKGSLLCSQELATGPLPSARWIQSTTSHPIILKIHSNIILPSMPKIWERYLQNKSLECYHYTNLLNLTW